MSRKVRLRLIQALVLLALAFGAIELPSAEAQWDTCMALIGCEYCQCEENRCIAEDPECAGNAACCRAKLSFCWFWCGPGGPVGG